MSDNLTKRVMLDSNIIFSAMYKADGTPFNAFAKASKMPYHIGVIIAITALVALLLVVVLILFIRKRKK